MQENTSTRPGADHTGREPQDISPDAEGRLEGASAGHDPAAYADVDASEQAAEIDPRDARIAELEAELANAKDQQLRALAEAENVRRRAQREREEAAKYGGVSLARDLLNVADNLRRAIEAVPAEAAERDPAIKSLIEGIMMVEKELAGVFEKHHVQPVPGIGEPFDHNVHQAVVELPTEEVPPGHVAQVLQTGYQLHDRLLRAAMVAVGKAP
jgi:molecular chaperone GrpE